MKKILIALLLVIGCLHAVVLPINKVIGSTYEDISAEVDSIGLVDSENFTIYNDSGSRLEVIVDNTGVADVNSTLDGEGIDLNPEDTEAFVFSGPAKYYVRTTKGNAALIKINKLGATNVHDVDFHQIAFNEFFHEHTGVDTNLSVAAPAGSTSITVDSATGFTIGTSIQIENGVIETTLPIITDVNGTLLTLDRPLDFSFEIGDSVEVVSSEIKVNATLAAPRSFRLIPDTDKKWHVISLTISLVHASAADDSKFGDAAALINGLVFRGYNGETGQYRTFTNWKNNGDIGLDFGEVTYTDKAGSGLHGTKATASIKFRAGAIPSIDGSKGDYLEVLAQDLLLTLLGASGSVRFKGQGHVIGL